MCVCACVCLPYHTLKKNGEKALLMLDQIQAINRKNKAPFWQRNKFRIKKIKIKKILALISVLFKHPHNKWYMSCSFSSQRMSSLSAARASILIWNTDNIEYHHFKIVCKKKKALHRSAFLSDGKGRKSESSVETWGLVSSLSALRTRCQNNDKTLFFAQSERESREKESEAFWGERSGGQTGGEAG